MRITEETKEEYRINLSNPSRSNHNETDFGQLGLARWYVTGSNPPTIDEVQYTEIGLVLITFAEIW